MQTRRLITAVLASFLVFYAWLILSTWLWPPPPAPPRAEGDALVSGTQPATSTAPADQLEMPSAQVGPGSAPAAPTPGAAYVRPAAASPPVILGSDDEGSPYPMRLTIVSAGASVSDVMLRGYKDHVKSRYVDPMPYPILGVVPSPGGPGLPDAFRSFTTRRVLLQFGPGASYDVPLDMANWELHEDQRPRRAVYRATVVSPSGQPLAHVIKTYELPEQPPDSMTFDLKIDTAVQNLTTESMQAIITQQGPIGLRREDQRADDRTVLTADWTESGLAVNTKKMLHRRKVFEVHKQFLGGDSDQARTAWTCLSNRYFACVMAPAGRGGLQDEKRFASVEAIHFTDIEEEQALQDLTFQYITHPMLVPAGQHATVEFDCYIGPKRKEAFQKVDRYDQREYSRIISANFYACAPTAVVWFMMWLLGIFEGVVRNYGVAIIILVLVVRAALHPLTKKSQINIYKMQRDMGRLQPKLQALKEKYAKDRQKMNQAMMELYQQEGVNPAGGMLSCLPMFLQIPIWGALWAGLNYTIEMRHQPFDGWWITDLAGPDALIPFQHPVYIPILSHYILGGPIHGLNLLPILLAITQIIQTKYMPRSAPASQDPNAVDQLEQQRKMMMFMSVIFMVFLYNAPSGLNLYIMASNIFGIIEQRRIKKHLDQGGLATALPSPKPGGPPSPSKDEPPKQKSWLANKWAELQKQAEQAKRIQTKQRKR